MFGLLQPQHAGSCSKVDPAEARPVVGRLAVVGREGLHCAVPSGRTEARQPPPLGSRLVEYFLAADKGQKQILAEGNIPVGK